MDDEEGRGFHLRIPGPLQVSLAYLTAQPRETIPPPYPGAGQSTIHPTRERRRPNSGRRVVRRRGDRYGNPSASQGTSCSARDGGMTGAAFGAASSATTGALKRQSTSVSW